MYVQIYKRNPSRFIVHAVSNSFSLLCKLYPDIKNALFDATRFQFTFKKTVNISRTLVVKMGLVIKNSLVCI